MKNTNILKSLNDLPPVTTEVEGAPSPTLPELSPASRDTTNKGFRELLRLRATTPLIVAIPHHRCGLNE